MPGSLEPLDLVGVQIPYHFRCPISLELMRDPVTVSTGQTYDRSSIEAWVATGNTTCPVTRAPLNDFNLIPNHTLRRLIQDWCVANRAFGVERIPTPKQPADPALVRSLLNQASSRTSPYTSRLSALRRLRGLSRDSDKNRSIIASHNVRELLLGIVFSNTESESSSELNHEALGILVMFPLNESQCTAVASDPDRVAYLSRLLFHNSDDVRVSSASLIEIVVAGTRVPELRALISNVDVIYEGVMDILRNPISHPRALKVGIKVLFALCLVKQTRHKAVAAGAAYTLIDRLADFEKCDSERALATIELLCRIPSGCAAFAEHALTVPLLVKTILKISNRATEYAAGALASLCSSSEHSRREAVAAGILTQLLLLVQSDCTERAKRKAQLLLKLLRDSWPDISIGNSDDFACSEVDDGVQYPPQLSSSQGIHILLALLEHPFLVSASTSLKATPERKFSFNQESDPGNSTMRKWVYVFQKEYATVDPNFVHFAGTDEATTCVGLVIRNRANGMTSFAHMDSPDIVDMGLSQMLSHLVDSLDAELDVHLIGGFEDVPLNHVNRCDRSDSSIRLEGYSVPLCAKIVQCLLMRQETIHIQTICILGHNTKRDAEGNACPILHGFVAETATGSVFPACFDRTSRCPDEIVRRIRVTASLEDPTWNGKLLETYDTQNDRFKIAPCCWTLRQYHIASTLQHYSDSEILSMCSTSPSAEAPDFVENLRRQWDYLIEHPYWRETFPRKQPRTFERTADGGWKRC